jgi:membrane-bound lytic murein transglycosylase D
MRRSGSKDGNYWDLYPFLPRETRGYVPAFIAVNYVMQNASAHNLYPVAPEANFFETDTIVVNQPVDLTEIAEIINEPVDYLQFLNPSYKTTYVPAYNNKSNFLVLPADKIGLYIQNEELVYTQSIKEKENDGTASVQKFEEDRIVYRVRSGDYLGKIAQQHRVSVSNLRRWNGLRGNTIRAGQRLVIYPNGNYKPQNNSSAQKTEEKKTEVVKEGDYIYYTIQSGDTLWDIAKARGVSVDELKRFNQHLNFNKLKPGMKVIVGSNS